MDVRQSSALTRTYQVTSACYFEGVGEVLYFAYFDESGDSGLHPSSPTRSFTLCGLLIHDQNWLSALDQTVAFRRYLRDQFRIPSRMELKASWLIHNKGGIRASGLTFPARMAVYRAVMRFQRKSGLFHTFAVVINKPGIRNKDTDVREYAWRFALQRLERFGTANKDNIHVLPDEGHGDFILKKIRAMRRFHRVQSAFGEETLDRRAENIIEDPSDRNSKNSYLIQLADLNAYAAFRKVFPGPNFTGDIWDGLGAARIRDVNKLRGGPPGIVAWP